MSLPKGTVTLSQSAGGGLMIADIHGVSNLHIGTQAELDALHQLVAEGKPLPLKPAPGQRPTRQPRQG